MSSDEIIKALCKRAIAAEAVELESALCELHAALKAHMENLRALTATALLNPVAAGDTPQE